ncbi:methionine ABC transporter permease [Corynebacterium sp. HS2168-gen11]|uniref:methionine ABC transporter permease n=1 Tax=Corynebacterium sp. HS2168-gen11 TaxID=2974027 RepID=UPI00216B6632|nr:methionine ABC transporter permease [Corynebacterium sp. HS2168-gen11]MCS4535906.1 ABC transporter permease [Corynebacterium sp. HS2168-gen11]
MTTHILAATDWSRISGTFYESLYDTLIMVSVTMLVGGFFGLCLGILLYTTREGGILRSKGIFTFLNVLVNFIRPIPFIILLSAFGPLTVLVIGSQIGRDAAVFGMSIAATFGVSRIVEQNLVSIDPGVIEAARAMGASPWKIITSVIIPEALGPLIMGYTFVFIAIVDMSAMAGYIGGGGIGDFAIVYGYRAYDFKVMYFAVFVIIIFVQLAQLVGNYLARKVMRR